MNCRPLLVLPFGLLLGACALLPKDGDQSADSEVVEGGPVLTSSVDSESSSVPEGTDPPTEPSENEETPNPAPTTAGAPTDEPNFFAGLWQSAFPPKPEPPPAATAPNWIGAVKAVSDRHDYVLVDSQNYQSPPPGSILTTVGAESETGTVRVSDDRDPPFFIADVISGRPAPGDRLYSPAQ